MDDETRNALSSASRSLEHAVDGLRSAASTEHLPLAVRSQVFEALIATTRVAGLLEAIVGGFVDLPEVRS